jgi:hypothetical protein
VAEAEARLAEAEARLAEAVTEAEACLAEVAGSEHVRTAGTERSRHLINAHTCQTHTERPKRSDLWDWYPRPRIDAAVITAAT